MRRAGRAYNAAMISALALLLAAAGPVTPVAPDPPSVTAIRKGSDVVALCGALVPPERLRSAGDALEGGEDELRQEEAREGALTRRYEVVLPARSISFARYDARDGRLSLADGADLLAAEGVARVYAIDHAGLPVEVDPAAARRILAAAKAKTLTLTVAFDLPDEAVCTKVEGVRRYTVPMDPASWTYRDGATVLARGGEGSDLPVVTAAEGARPRVEVDAPYFGGPADAKAAVAGRAERLEACYREALKRNPGLDGVLAVDLGGAKPVVSVDSVGDAPLAGCVVAALDGLTAAEKVTVPVRFVLEAPAARR
jgi:hypothetical protein